ncbi:hypothetical protein BGZ72_001991 [Mortierella alpina]|nr:hypothetical protein BGZ72_001991 [Mortierella alpina]
MDSPDFISVSPPPRLHRSTSNSTLSSFVLLSEGSQHNSHVQDERRSTTSSTDFSIKSLPDSIVGPSNPVPGHNQALSALSDASYLSLELEDLSLYTDTHDSYRYVAPHPPEIQYAFPSTPMAARYFPSNMPSRVARTIFALLDRHTLQSTLTVSKGWFRYAAGFLYRDPFDSEQVHAQNCGTLRSLVSPSSRQSLRPSDERKLVRLLLRSIGCPSEPGEKAVLVCEENEWVMGKSMLVDEHGNQIHTSVNYIRFLEVFDWAPWQRYLDFWDTTQLLLEDEEEDKRAILAEIAIAQMVEKEEEEEAKNNKVNSSSDSSSNEEGDDYFTNAYKNASYVKRRKAWKKRAREQKKAQKSRGKDEQESSKDKGKDVVREERPSSMYRPSKVLFRFSYSTIFDWFAENPNATTIVVHPQMRFPFQLVPQLTRWSRLLFDQCEPDKDDVHRKRALYDDTFNSAALLQGIFEHQMHSYINAQGRTVGGIRHLQLPPAFLFDDNDHLAEVQSLIDVIVRPTSLDVSAFSLWIYTAMGIPSENLVELTRFVCLTAPNGFLSHQSFLRRCPNLKELELLIRDTRDANFGDTDVAYPYRDLFTESEDDMQQVFHYNDYRSASRSVEPYRGPPTPRTLKLTSSKLYAQRSADLPHLLAAMQSQFSDSLRELKLARASALYSTHYRRADTEPRLCRVWKSTLDMPHLTDLHLELCEQFELQGLEPFSGCPRLQRLTLISSQPPVASPPWRVPNSLKELVLDGYDTQIRLDLVHLCVCVPGLESLTLISTMPAQGKVATPLLDWPPYARLIRLRNMILSGLAAKSFRFEWVSGCPALETLEVDGLDYSQLTQGQHYTDGAEPMALDSTPHSTHGPRVCKFSIEDMTCYHSMLYDFFCLNVANKGSSPKAAEEEDRAESEMMWNRPLLTALRQHCPNVHRLTVDVKSCHCRTTGTREIHSELDVVTLSKLSRFLPSLIRFGTDSFKITGRNQSHLRSLGFVPRLEPRALASYTLPRGSRWEACAYRFGEASYQRHVKN